MGSSVSVQKNLFDYKVRFQTNDLILYSFGDIQCRAKKYREGIVHLLCNREKYESLDFKLVVDQRIMRVKINLNLYHEVFSVI